MLLVIDREEQATLMLLVRCRQPLKGDRGARAESAALGADALLGGRRSGPPRWPSG